MNYWMKLSIGYANQRNYLDGVLYIKGNNKMHRSITGKLKGENIMSSLVLREFLYQL